MPAEPEGSTPCTRIRTRSDPVAVRSGIVFAHLGEGALPAFPQFDCFVAAETHGFACKGLIACNRLQALEVGIDPFVARDVAKWADVVRAGTVRAD